jgi:hypothetical protein
MSSSPSKPTPQTDARLAGGLLAMFFVMTAVASTYAPVTRTFPLMVGVCGCVLSAVEFARLSRHARSSPRVPGESQRQRVVMFAWVTLAIALSVAFGIVIGSALFVSAYLRARGRESWPFTLGGAASVIAVLYLLLERLLELPLYDGMIGWR